MVRLRQSHLHLERFRAINGDSSSLTHNFGGVNEILQDLLVYVCECTRTRSLLLHPRVTGRFAQHATLSDEDNMAIRELLFQLTGESARWVIVL